jgi:hypothetical protein
MVELNSSEQVFRFDQLFFQKQANRNYQNTIKNLKVVLQKFAIFNLTFFTIFALETVLFVVLFAALIKSSILAIILGVIFLSFFTYFVLLFYFQAKKSDQLATIKDHFIQSCRQVISTPSGSAEHHLTIAHAALRLSDQIKIIESKLYLLPQKINFLSSMVNKMGSSFHK